MAIRLQGWTEFRQTPEIWGEADLAISFQESHGLGIQHCSCMELNIENETGNRKEKNVPSGENILKTTEMGATRRRSVKS